MDQAPDQNMHPEDGMLPPEDAKKGPAYGSILGIVLIVAILVAGAFYVWNERLEMNQVPENGVRGEVLPDGSVPSVEGGAGIEEGESGPQPQ